MNITYKVNFHHIFYLYTLDYYKGFINKSDQLDACTIRGSLLWSRDPSLALLVVI